MAFISAKLAHMTWIYLGSKHGIVSPTRWLVQLTKPAAWMVKTGEFGAIN
jgi:hypothetical protein